MDLKLFSFSESANMTENAFQNVTIFESNSELDIYSMLDLNIGPKMSHVSVIWTCRVHPGPLVAPEGPKASK